MKKIVASFSGGKDSSLALYKAMQEGEIVAIIHMMNEEGKRSRSHGMSETLIQAQAEAIGAPLLIGCASWEQYEEVFIEQLKKAKALGAQELVTGDIDLVGHKEWNERVTSCAGLGLLMPLWQQERQTVVNTFINLGFESVVVTVNLKKGMKREDLGRVMDPIFVAELIERGIDACGEGGEFHTMVVEGPIFKQRILVEKGRVTDRGDYSHLELLKI